MSTLWAKLGLATITSMGAYASVRTGALGEHTVILDNPEGDGNKICHIELSTYPLWNSWSFLHKRIGMKSKNHEQENFNSKPDPLVHEMYWDDYVCGGCLVELDGYKGLSIKPVKLIQKEKDGSEKDITKNVIELTQNGKHYESIW